MMDPAQQPTNSDMRDFPRKVHETPRRPDSKLGVGQPPKATPDDAFRQEALRYREFFDFAPDAYLITDAAGNIREANVAAGRMLGVEPQFLSGKPLPSFFDDAGRKQYRRQLDKLCDFDHLDDWEIALHRRNGECVTVSVSIARARGKGRTGHRWILRDISTRSKAESDLRERNRELEQRISSRTIELGEATQDKDALLIAERKAREEAEAANRLKADFLALLSHEFRTPLQAIFGYTELLERQIHGPLNEAQLRDLHRIQLSQQHLLGLITTILDFARLESGKDIELHLGPTDVHEILSEMEGFVGAELEKRGLSYAYQFSDEHIVAFADPAKVQQIVLNLLANAIKFTPAEGRISLECEADGASVMIRVIDSGIGIPADELETVFQPFVQIRNKYFRNEGTGLGLPISRRLATAMGGMLTAESVEGKGSTFTLRLPLIKSDARRALASG
ncbi:MAG TPA: ATP-binding protein [Gemmatimonadaceae bacterium]|nr:ATP-binding protein [Gemmatimonadaceae bacterium]